MHVALSSNWTGQCQNSKSRNFFVIFFAFILLHLSFAQQFKENSKRFALNIHSREPRIPKTFVTECMHVASKPGEYIYRNNAPGPAVEGSACGLYFMAPPNAIIEIELELIDVSCHNGLVVFFDGWEMNGKVFPTSSDHPLPLVKRFAEFCNQRKTINRRFKSSQNAALIQYKIPVKGEGFVVRARFFKNPEPCNVLMSEVAGEFTLENFGKNRNCTLTSVLYPANLRVLEMKVGTQHESEVNCCAGGQDYLEFGGSADLESNQLSASEVVCGCHEPKMRNKGITVLCGSTTMRLISSGQTSNKVTIYSKPATEEDLDTQENLILLCPDFL